MKGAKSTGIAKPGAKEGTREQEDAVPVDLSSASMAVAYGWR